MSKFLSSLAISIAICTTNLPLQAQVNSPVKPTPIPSNSIQPVTTPNLELFTKSVLNFYQHRQIRTKSNSSLDLTSAGAKLQVFPTNETIAETGNKFRSEVSFTSPSSTALKYSIISNGKTVWIYRPDLKQYSQVSLAKFERDRFWIGMSSALFSMMPELERLKLNKEFNSSQFMQMLAGSMSQNLTSEKIILDRRELYAFSFKDIIQEIAWKGFVDPKNSELSQLELAGKYNNMDISMKETIVERKTISVDTKGGFTFTPPKGVKKVKKLAIAPF